MTQPIASRYEFTDNNEAIIDVSVHSIENLYSNFDRTAPYSKKDLDEELVNYLVDSVREIRNNKFIIRISLSHAPDKTLIDRVKKSINTYYDYLKELEVRNIKEMFKRSFILFCVGLVLLALAIEVATRLTVQHGVLTEVFAQGLTVAAWVSLWEAIANLFLEWSPHKKNISLFNRIIDAPVIFRYLEYTTPA
jgi:DNA-binding protein Fis